MNKRNPVNLNSTSRRPIQYGLRSLAIATFVLAVIIANGSAALEFAYDFFGFATLAIAILAFVIGQQARATIVPNSSHVLRLAIVRLTLVLFSVQTMGALWARYRWDLLFAGSSRPRTFPYPDATLIALHHWLDAQYPAPLGHLKMEGEFYSVLLILDVAAWLSVLLVGFCFGLLLRPVVPVGLRHWHSAIMALIGKATQ